ncbi:vinorine synthase-like [Magnolia sinica]|uniref:vinorine synthase-like n=1 Tax=Magnolia sinica TaxID=86752 RepID=UPI00265AD837|nr:vinorine synthase-like [Magnolia sinica]
MWKVHIISTETIKPSSPTPPHLSKILLSLLDQLNRPHYIRFVLFYSNNGGSPLDNCQQLKKSLSETLSRFYPLAGRIEGDSSIECNDMGAGFIQARVDGQLTEYLRMPDIKAVDGFLPCELTRTRSGRDVLLAVQLNSFDCGGLAIGVGISHKVADAASSFMFLNGWAATARGAADEVMAPTFEFAKLIPPIEIPPSMQNSMPMEENLVTKCFVFDGSKIAALRTRATGASYVGQPTRVETVSALIWRCIIKLRPSTASVAFHIVNLRRRMVPPLPDHLFGNFISIGATSPVIDGVGDGDMQHYLESELKDAIRKVDGNDIIKLRGLDGPQEILAFLKALSEKCSSQSGMDLCYFNSWCGFPIYDVDFGWGRPIWDVTLSKVALKKQGKTIGVDILRLLLAISRAVGKGGVSVCCR